MAKLAIIGSGAWGSALSIALSKNFDKIYIICRNKKQADDLLPQHSALNVKFANNIIATHNYQDLTNIDGILIATPSYAFVDVLMKIKPYFNNQPIAWATKGFSEGKLLHETFNQILPQSSACVISGPTFATLVANFEPSALVVASNNKIIQDFWVNSINTRYIRVYISDDIIGVEVGGAIKNILAIAAGLSVGLGFGANAMSALIARGLAEMSRLGLKLGANKDTFMGLAGLGDLTLTCLDDLSRNRRFGKKLAKGISIEQAINDVGATVEGLNALNIALNIAKKYQVEMPICEQVLKIVEKKITAKEAVQQLINRSIIYE